MNYFNPNLENQRYLFINKKHLLAFLTCIVKVRISVQYFFIRRHFLTLRLVNYTLFFIDYQQMSCFNVSFRKRSFIRFVVSKSTLLPCRQLYEIKMFIFKDSINGKNELVRQYEYEIEILKQQVLEFQVMTFVTEQLYALSKKFTFQNMKNLNTGLIGEQHVNLEILKSKISEYEVVFYLT